MTVQDHRPFSEPLRTDGDVISACAMHLMRSVLGQPDHGELIVETAGGRAWTFGGSRPGPCARLTVHHWRGLARIATGGDIGLADAYAAGEVSSPDIGAVLQFGTANADMTNRLSANGAQTYWRRLRHGLNRNTRFGSRRNISAHYDLGNDFYRCWLDASMTYSSALFASASQSLEDAQTAKLDHIVDLLDLRGGESVLEIGFGWGSLAERLLQRHDCTVAGVTLSAQQLDFARQRLASFIAAGRCDLRLQDYRDVNRSFDRVVSIEMLEAVGEAYWPIYFGKLRACLKPGGLAVLQVISIDQARFAGYRRSSDFIQQRIFPGGMLPTADIVGEQAERAGLRLTDRQFIGASYAQTLAVWRQRFRESWPAIERLGFDQKFKRMWEFYLEYCRVGFEASAIDVGIYRFS